MTSGRAVLPDHPYALIAGGGTAGHVLPALAVARALGPLGHTEESVEMVSSRRGQAIDLLADAGFPVLALPGRGLRRSLGPADLWANLGAVAGLVAATGRAIVSVRRHRPSVVVSVGGYASFPAGLAAVVAGVPLVLVNVDAVPGLVHRLLDRFSTVAAVAFPATKLRRAVVTGTPVRDEVTGVERSPAAAAAVGARLGIPPGRRLMAVFGGSLGARSINEATLELADRWKDREDLALVHVTGRRDWPALSASRATESTGPGLWYRMVEFESRMVDLYTAADLFLCRAGAMTVGELAVVGVPAILVPLPGAPGDHQTANARSLVDAGGAVLVPDPECRAEVLAPIASELLADGGRLEQMGAAARRLGRKDAAERIARLVVRHAR